jgi:membrane-bound lytic murein transglycosylase D
VRSRRQWGFLVPAALGAALSACAHGGAKSQELAPVAQAPQPAPDPVAKRISAADAELQMGLALAKEGHLNGAREAFDRAIDVYLTAPGGAYGNPRLADAFRRTLETVQLRELEALAAGDGFTEQQVEPASIDEVGDIAVAEGPPSEETRRTTQEAVREETNDVSIELNDAVLGCIELYQGRLRDWFTAALARGGRYLPTIRQVFREEGIPQDLAYVALVESAFKPHAYSRAKARGVWQFISATGRRYGLDQDWWVDERSNPEKATRAAARYLKDLYQMFGDWSLALAGYNAGEQKVLRGLDRYGVSDYWSLSRTSALRRETKNYVPMIHAAIVVAKAPEKYGFDFTPEPPLTYDTAAVAGPFDLRLVSECAGASLDDVRLLNPELRRLATPARRTFEIKVPVGTGNKLSECLAAVPANQRVSFRTHVVGRGQTLASIAKRYGTRTSDIADANGLAPKKRLAVGTELIIPIDPKVKTVAAHPTAPARDAPVGAGSSKDKERQARVNYRIKPGDTLAAIASQYRTTIRDIQAWNGLRSTRIAAGATLTIYTGRN